MKIIYDSTKDEANIIKHELSLADALRIDWSSLYAMEDTRHDYGETRIDRLCSHKQSITLHYFH